MHGVLTWQTVVEDVDVINKIVDVTGVSEGRADILKLTTRLTVTQQFNGCPVLCTVVMHQLSAVESRVRRTTAVGAREQVWNDVLAVDG